MPTPHEADAPDGADSPPRGFLESVGGGARLVARADVHDELRGALTAASLHQWARARPGARGLHGRAVAWAVTLANGAPVVVRHSRHGGMLAGVTGDLFVAPTRAPAELVISRRLRAAGVPTPDVLAYATYSVVGPFCRADVVTGFVDGRDFPQVWRSSGPEGRPALVAAVGHLLRLMADAGATHADLNAKNILIAGADGRAWILDVDRVELGNGAAAPRNLERLARSLAKWRRVHGLDFSADDWAMVASAAGLPGAGARYFA